MTTSTPCSSRIRSAPGCWPPVRSALPYSTAHRLRDTEDTRCAERVLRLHQQLDAAGTRLVEAELRERLVRR